MPPVMNYLNFLPSYSKLPTFLNKTYPLWKSHQQFLHPIKLRSPNFYPKNDFGNKIFISNMSKQSSKKPQEKGKKLFLKELITCHKMEESNSLPSALASTHASKTMGQGQESKTRSDPQVEIQERGEIFFFYRPKVNKEEAHSADDVQRMYIVLRPESGEKPVEEKQSPDSGKEGAKSGHSSSSSEEEKGEDDEENRRLKDHPEGGHGTMKVNIEKQPLLRFIVMGRKSLPDLGKKSRPFWGFVELVTTKIDDIKDALHGEEYDTATRGHRHKPDARAFGEGVYRILRHKYSERKMHTHLVYKLELPPEKKNEPQEELNVEREGSFIIQIKNPEQGGAGRRSEFQGLSKKRKAVFPAHLQGRFGSKQYEAADPPDFLNYEGCEFLVISASDDIEEELGLEIHPEADVLDPKCSDLVKTFGEDAIPTAPLFEGGWC